MSVIGLQFASVFCAALSGFLVFLEIYIGEESGIRRKANNLNGWLNSSAPGEAINNLKSKAIKRTEGMAYAGANAALGNIVLSIGWVVLLPNMLADDMGVLDKTFLYLYFERSVSDAAIGLAIILYVYVSIITRNHARTVITYIASHYVAFIAIQQLCIIQYIVNGPTEQVASAIRDGFFLTDIFIDLIGVEWSAFILLLVLVVAAQKLIAIVLLTWLQEFTSINKHFVVTSVSIAVVLFLLRSSLFSPQSSETWIYQSIMFYFVVAISFFISMLIVLFMVLFTCNARAWNLVFFLLPFELAGLYIALKAFVPGMPFEYFVYSILGAFILSLNAFFSSVYYFSVKLVNMMFRTKKASDTPFNTLAACFGLISGILGVGNIYVH